MKMKVRVGTQTYKVDIDDIHARPVIAFIDGERFEVWHEEEQKMASADITNAPEISIPEPQSGPLASVQRPRSGSTTEVISPLPGVIVAIPVKPGDKVTHGQELCTLEAMKMKNAIRSNREGTIASIAVNIGDQVNHGQVLMTFEE